MTAQQLIAMVAGERTIGGKKVIISPENVYLAANFIQTEICTELLPLEGTPYPTTIPANTDTLTITAIGIAQTKFCRRTDSNSLGVITKVSEELFERERLNSGTVATQAGVLRYCEYQTNPPQLVFQPKPTVDTNIAIHYYKKPLDSEFIAQGVNPMLGNEYDNALLFGTLAQALISLPDDTANAKGEEYQQKYMLEKQRLGAILANRKFIPNNNQSPVVVL